MYELCSVVDRQEVQLHFLQQLTHAALYLRPPPGIAGALFLDLSQGAGRIPQGGVLDLAKQLLCYCVSLCGHSLNRRLVEPLIDPTLQHAAAIGEEQQHRDQGQTDIGGDQPGLELRAQDPVVTLHRQLEEVACQDEQNGQDEGEIDVPEDEEEDPVGDQLRGQVLPPLGQVVEQRERQQQDGQAADDPAGVLSVGSNSLAQ